MYNFLNNIRLVDTGRLRKPKQDNPTGLTLRIFANGKVYPSKELVDKFNLEYLHKENENVSNAIDVIDSTEWSPLATAPRMILFGITPKTNKKVDIFGTSRYNEDGTPKSSVINQGTASESLLNLVRSIGYLTEEQTYCDLEIVLEHPIKTEDGIAYIPKVVERGGRVGEKTYERRENMTMYPVNTPENLVELRKQQTEQIIQQPITSN